MSQMVTRQGPVGEDIDKRQTASPVKEMKKKMAANAEKEKIAAEKHVDKHDDKADKTADKKDKKETEKHADKAEKKDKTDKSHDKRDKSLDKSIDKKDKSADKSVDKKADKAEKKEKTAEKKDQPADKKEKNIDIQVDKSTESKETEEKPVDKPEESTSAEKTGKQSKDEDKQNSATIKQNGEASRQNGKASNGTASESDDGEEELVIVEPDNDEMFPELAYDDTSDTEPTDTDIRSVTRRSQVKVTRTPETPRPASVKQTDKETDDSKEMKLLKLKEDVLITDRRLRSANSPKPSDKRPLDKDSPKKEIKKSDLEIKSLEETGAEDKQESAQKNEGIVTEMVIEVENIEGGGPGGEGVRRDTRFSRSRVKVSPYRRSTRLTDNTATSILANYTGNNTTMEMDITESFAEAEAETATEAEAAAEVEADTSAEDSYLASLRTIRARRSYRDLKPLTFSHSFNTSQHSLASFNGRESNVRPTGTVVGRKRRPEVGGSEGEGAAVGGGEGAAGGGKRPRLLERLARPFRTTSTPLPARRAAEIVGINTDLPQSAPVAADDAFDPETIKPTPTTTPTHTHAPTHAPTHTLAADRDSKRCVVM